MTTRVVRPALASGRVAAPASKSYTHRAVVLGHLSGRKYVLDHPLVSDDTLATLRGVGELGSDTRRRPNEWTVAPSGDSPSGRARTVNCGESGTTLRFLLSAAARLSCRVRFVAQRGLRERPHSELIDAIRQGGVTVRYPGPGTVVAELRGPMHPIRCSLDGSQSSQPLSSLLLTLPTLDGPSTIRLRGPVVSRPYLEATLRFLSAHRIVVRRRGRRFDIPAPQRSRGSRIRIPGDASSSAYLWAAGALTGGAVTVRGVGDLWPQADLAILELIERMGASVDGSRGEVRVSGPLQRPLRADLTDTPDLLPLVAVLAAATPGRSVLQGAAHASGKESDRRTESARLAAAMGAGVRLTRNRLVIDGRRDPRRFVYGGAGDHRMVMSAAVGALAADGPSRIGSAESVRKSFPEFWATLGGLTRRSGVEA
jgi:3-phosphoshikimate 1-carboxyvinyltransferase